MSSKKLGQRAKAKLAGINANKAAPVTPAQRVAELIEMAQLHIDRLEFQSAVQCYQQVLELDPHNHGVMDELAELLIQLGKESIAKQILEFSIALAPDAGYTKYMNLAQLLEGHEALKYYRIGLEKMVALPRNAELDAAIASGFCSMTEHYLTDLCDEPDAEQQCERLVEHAMRYAPNTPEPHQVLASVRISQQRNVDALAALKHSISLWHHPRPEDEEEDENGDAAAAQNDEELPSYDFRMNTCQLLLELEQHQLAAELLEGLIEEDDEVLEVLYMAAEAYSHFDGPSAKEYLQDAVTLAGKQAIPADDPMRQQLTELTQRLSHLPDAPARAPDGDEDGEEDDDEDNEEEEEGPPRRMDE